MKTKEAYIEVFYNVFEIKEEEMQGLEYQGIDVWDSVGHMALISALEEKFEIMMEMDDIIDFSSFEKGMEIISKYGFTFDTAN